MPIRPNSPTVSSCVAPADPVDGSNGNRPCEHTPSGAAVSSRHAPVTVRFLGWFGPRGLASIVFVPILVEQTELPERSLMLIVVTWTVALSVYAQRLTAWPGANR